MKVNPPDKTIMAAETNFQRPLEAKVSDNSVSNRKRRKCTNNRGKSQKRENVPSASSAECAEKDRRGRALEERERREVKRLAINNREMNS